MSKTYFNKLNYTLANEDTALELELLPQGVNHLVSVAGSGGRVLPLLAKAPKKVTCVDLSQEQLYLTELRFESVRALTHSEFLSFWGYPPTPAEPDERRKLFKKIKLGSDAQAFFDELFQATEWDSILYMGSWERTISKLSFVNRRITGMRGIGLFSAIGRTEHFRYLKQKFPTYAWALTLSLLGNASVFNSLLYKGHFPKKNIPQSSFKYYQDSFKRIFDQGPARENFLLQLLFFGKILFPEGNPIECDAKVFSQAKKALKEAEIHYLKGNILEVVENAKPSVDLLSLSDVPSYFSGETERRFMQKIKKGMSPGGMVVIRNYLHVPEGTDYAGFECITPEYSHLIKKEKVQLYQVEVYRRA